MITISKAYPLMLAALLATAACDDSLVKNAGEGGTTGAQRYAVTITIDLPDDLQGVELTDETYAFKNISTGRTSTFDTPEDISVMAGLYDVTYTAKAHLPGGSISDVRAFAQSVEVTGPGAGAGMTAWHNITTDDLVIAEVFFSGTLQPSGNSYYGDDYVKLYNNTGHVVYADGVTLFETKFLTTQKYVYEPDVMDRAVTVQALYTVPGNGTEHPIEPGGYLTLADVAIDHRVANPNSFDLSHADFEWYDVSSSPSHMDIDNPDVPNLDKWYCYTQSFWMLHDRGFKAYGIARIPIDKETYLRDYRYDYDYTMVLESGTFPMSQSAYMLPNEWVVDIVNCSVASAYAWNLCAPSLDMGWTYCGTIDKDKTRYFHSVRRKMLHKNDAGNPVLKDTNNSTEDFNPFCIPSEIEHQHTATDADGTPCTTLTYDGVTPMDQQATR